MIENYYNVEFDNVVFDIDNTSEWLDMMNELGLENQTKFLKSSKSPLPFPLLNNNIKNIFSTLCPAIQLLKDYTKTPIPLDAIKVIKFAVQEKYFDKIEIWYDDKTPDPIAVGSIVNYKAYYYPEGSNSSVGTDYMFKSHQEAQDWVDQNGHKWYFATSEVNEYLICRWGDELRPIKELKQLAKDRLVEKYTNDWQLTIKECQRKIDQSAELITKYLNGEITTYDLER